jgi:arylsulfatase A
LGKKEQPAHEFLYWEFPGYGGQQAVRLGNWKALRQNMHKGNTQIQLFNLAADISETTDVASRHPDVIERIQRIMREQHTPSERFPFKAIDGK